MTVACLWPTNSDNLAECSSVDVSTSRLTVDNTDVDIVVCKNLKGQTEISTEWLSIAPHGNWRQTPASWNKWLPIIQFCRHATRQVFISDESLPCAADQIPYGHRDLYEQLINHVINMWQRYDLVSQMQVDQMKGLYGQVIDENLVLTIRLLEQHIRQFDVEPIEPSTDSGFVILLKKTMYGDCAQNHLGHKSVPAENELDESSAIPRWLLHMVPMIAFAFNSGYNLLEAKNSQYESARVRSQYYRDDYHETVADGYTATTAENHDVTSATDDVTTQGNIMNLISDFSNSILPDKWSYVASQDTLSRLQVKVEEEGLLLGIDTSGLNTLITLLGSEHSMDSTEYMTEVAQHVTKMLERSHNQMQLMDFLQSVGADQETSEQGAKLRLMIAGLVKQTTKSNRKIFGLLSYLKSVTDGQWNLAAGPVNDIIENGIYGETAQSAAQTGALSALVSTGVGALSFAGTTALGIVGIGTGAVSMPVTVSGVITVGVLSSVWHIFGATGANILTENAVEVLCDDDSEYCQGITRMGSLLAQIAVRSKLNQVMETYVSVALAPSESLPPKFKDVKELGQVTGYLNNQLKMLADSGDMDVQVLKGIQEAMGDDIMTIDALSKLSPGANFVAAAAMADIHHTSSGTAESQDAKRDLVTIVTGMKPDDLARRALSYFAKVTVTEPLAKRALTDDYYGIFAQVGVTWFSEGTKLLKEDLSEQEKANTIQNMWNSLKTLPTEGIDHHYGSNLPLSSDYLRFVNDVTVAMAMQNVINGNTVTAQCELAQKFHSGPNAMTMQNCVIMTQSNPDEAAAVDQAIRSLPPNPTAGNVAETLSHVVSGASELVSTEFLRAIPYVLRDKTLINQPVETIANRVLSPADVQVLCDGLVGAQRPMQEVVTPTMLESRFSHLASAVQASSPWSIKLLRSVTAQLSASIARGLYADGDKHREQKTVNGENSLYSALNASLVALKEGTATVYARKNSTLLADLSDHLTAKSNSVPADVLAWTCSLHGVQGVVIDEWLQKMDAAWNSVKTTVPSGYQQQKPSAVWAEVGASSSALFAELMSVRFPHAFDIAVLREIDGAIEDSSINNKEIMQLRDILTTQEKHVQTQTVYSVMEHGSTHQLRYDYDRSLATRVTNGQRAFEQLVKNHSQDDIKWNRMFMPLLSFDYPLEAPDPKYNDVYGMVSTMYNTGGPHLMSLRQHARSDLFRALSSNQDQISSSEWLKETLAAADVLADVHGISKQSMQEVIATVMKQQLGQIRSTVTATAITKSLAASICDASTSIQPPVEGERTSVVFDSLACSIMFQQGLSPDDSSGTQLSSSPSLDPGFRAALGLVAYQLDSPLDNTSIDAAITNAIEAATRAAKPDNLSQDRAIEQALAATAMAIAYTFERDQSDKHTPDARITAIDALVQRLVRYVQSASNTNALSNVMAMVPIIAGSKFDIAVVAAAAIGMPGTTGVESRDSLAHVAGLTSEYKKIRNLLSLRESVTESLAPVVRRAMQTTGYKINHSGGSALGLHNELIDFETAKDVVHTALGMENKGQFDVEQLLDLLHPALDKLIHETIKDTKSISEQIVSCISSNKRDEHGACNAAIAIFGQARMEALKRNGMTHPNVEAAIRKVRIQELNVYNSFEGFHP